MKNEITMFVEVYVGCQVMSITFAALGEVRARAQAMPKTRRREV